MTDPGPCTGGSSCDILPGPKAIALSKDPSRRTLLFAGSVTMATYAIGSVLSVTDPESSS